MYKNDQRLKNLVAFGIVLCVSTSLWAQSIGEIADAQRAKLQGEANAAAAPSKQTTEPAVIKPVRRQPSITLHSVYRLGDKVVAEATDGFNLWQLNIDAAYGKSVVVGITDGGVLVRKKVGCKPKCNVTRLVPVGGEL